MLIVRCTDKIRDRHDNIVAYTIKDDSGNTKNVYANQYRIQFSITNLIKYIDKIRKI
ncbi:MAG: hypothetical protein IJ593_04380 [Lachnospiraceae bacterium]|nr:hypothetical protein [Lachnospiraceae bacterium]